MSENCCNSCTSESENLQSVISINNSLSQESSLLKNKKFQFLMIAVGIVIPFQFFAFLSIHLPRLIELPFFLIITIWFGKKTFSSGFKSLLTLKFSDINLLMLIAVIGAFYLQQYEEAAIITVLFALGEELESYGIKKSQTALSKLIESAPKTAHVKGKSNKVPIEEVKVGEVVEVYPGDQIPLDGEVIKGDSLVNEASITGEPLPRNKEVGSMVYAGTFNGEGFLEIKVTKSSKDSTLAKIIELTYKSAANKASTQKFIEKFSKYYTPAIIVSAILLVIIPVYIFGQDFEPWLIQALTLLVIACPCALVISTPIAVFSAIGNATKQGILIKGGQFIEAIGAVGAIGFDKTRTLTKGEPIVSDIIAFNSYTKEEVIACAASMESLSKHPIAQSIISKAREMGVKFGAVENLKEISGKGLKADCLVCDDKHHCIGNMKFIEEEHEITEEVENKVKEFEAQGKTAIIISVDNAIKGIIAVTDEIRSESTKVVSDLKDLGIDPIVLTGDNTSSAGYVTSILGISEFKASLLPEDKVEEIKKMSEKYGIVAMIGDGVNDAAALATAQVGIAMGAISSDIAMENADIALMNVNLETLPFLVKLGRVTRKKIKFNIIGAILVKAFFIILAILGMSNLALAVFADVGMTIIVIMNSLSLFSYEAR